MVWVWGLNFIPHTHCLVTYERKIFVQIVFFFKRFYIKDYLSLSNIESKISVSIYYVILFYYESFF